MRATIGLCWSINRETIQLQQIHSYMAELYRLSQRSNINVYNYHENCRREVEDRRIILFDDHRTILDVLYFALQEGHFNGDVPSIISFDYHDDSVGLSSEVRQRANSLRNSCSVKRNDEKIWQFVEFSLGGMDDDWVRAGMELGLIKHYIGFGHHCSANNIDQGFEQYRSLDEVMHHLYSNGHLDGELGNRGVIGDESYGWQQKRNDLLDDIQYHHRHFDEGDIKPFVLDIDLDCFSTDCFDHTIAWPEAIFIERYQNPKVSSFIHYLINRASLITICRETGCCGGVGEANRILELLDYFWFDGALKTQRIV